MVSRVAGWDTLSNAARIAEREAHEADAANYQQGCETHFRRSGMRIKKDRAIVPPHLVDRFQVCIDTLLSPDTTLQAFNDTIRCLRSEFPPVMRSWINWWENPRISQIVFPACRPTQNDFRQSEVPQTSNPIETQHSLLHHATGTRYDLIPGIEALFRHVRQLQTQFQAAKGMFFIIFLRRNLLISSTS